MDNKKLYAMKLHEELPLNNYTSVLRVLSGWIYMTVDPRYEGDNMAVFVPYDNELTMNGGSKLECIVGMNSECKENHKSENDND